MGELQRQPEKMKSIIMLLLMTALPVFGTALQLTSVKQVLYLHGSDTDLEMVIVDVPSLSLLVLQSDVLLEAGFEGDEVGGESG